MAPLTATDAEFVQGNYVTVGCAFSATRFYANAQANDAVAGCDWEFENERHWKSLSPDAIALLQPVAVAPLLAPTVVAADEEERLERELRALLTTQRQTLTKVSSVYLVHFIFHPHCFSFLFWVMS